MLTQILVAVALCSFALVLGLGVATARRRRSGAVHLTRAILRDQDLEVMRARQTKLAESLPAPRRTTVRLPMGVGASGQRVARELHDGPA